MSCPQEGLSSHFGDFNLDCKEKKLNISLKIFDAFVYIVKPR